MNLFKLNIVNVKKSIFSNMVSKIKVRGYEGELEIFSLHAPLLTIIKPGNVQIKILLKEKCIYLHGGILEVQHNKVIILVN